MARLALLRSTPWRMEDGEAVRCFLSYFDAMFESALQVTVGLHYGVVPARPMPPDTFRAGAGRGRVASLHSAWPARRGQLVLGPRGLPASWGAGAARRSGDARAI